MRKKLLFLIFSLSLLSVPMKVEAQKEPDFQLFDLGKKGIVDYEKHGEFHNLGTKDYQYRIMNKKGLAQAVGEGIHPNTKSIQEDPLYQKLKSEGKLEGIHWDFVNIDNSALSFYKWATAPESPGVKQYYTNLALEKSGHYLQAIKGYHAILVHFPKTVGWTYFNTPWYIGKAARRRIEYLTRKYPELGIKLVDARIKIENGFDNDIQNDVFVYINPGKLIKHDAQKDKKIDLGKCKIIEKIGGKRTQLVKYENGHWQLLVDGKPYIIKGISYAPVKVGQTPDEGTLEDWMQQDTNNNGIIDAPYEAWVDKNCNNKQDDDEPTVGDFQLMKNMGVNTLRLYHHASNKELLKDLYKKYGIMVMLGDFVGMYTIGSGATWEEGTDYTNLKQQENMFNSVKEMVMEYKDEPYILMWVLGNENNYGGVHGHVGGVGNAAQHPDIYYSFINKLAKWIKEVDPNHPVAICNGDALFLDILAKNCPDIDILGVNSYQGSHGFYFWDDVKDTYGRPIVITEFGCPAYHEGMPFSVAEEEQADYNWGVWTDIIANSGGRCGAGNALGGVVFEWLDGWWKSGQAPFFSPYVHEPNGQWKGPFPNGWSYEEWFGLCSQGDGTKSPFMRQLKKSYYLYQKLWTEGTEDPVYAGGRIDTQDKDVFVFDGKSWNEILDIPKCHEIYTLIKDKDGNLWAGGNYFGRGKIWKYDGKNCDKGTVMDNSLVIYSLTQDKDGNLWAGGAGKNKVWKYDGKNWNKGEDIEDCSAVYAITFDKDGNLWATGAKLNISNIWKYDGTSWYNGGRLLGSKSIYALALDKNGNLWAAGESKSNRKLWKYNYDKKTWSRGTLLDGCEVIYALSTDKKGNLWAAGAGEKKIWKYDGENWDKGDSLNGCIAIYSLTEDLNGNIYAGGWSSKMTAKVWTYGGSSWDKGKELSGFVIRALEAIP